MRYRCNSRNYYFPGKLNRCLGGTAFNLFSKNRETIFRTADDMSEYMRDQHGDWLAVKHGSDEAQALKQVGSKLHSVWHTHTQKKVYNKFKFKFIQPTQTFTKLRKTRIYIQIQFNFTHTHTQTFTTQEKTYLYFLFFPVRTNISQKVFKPKWNMFLRAQTFTPQNNIMFWKIQNSAALFHLCRSYRGGPPRLGRGGAHKGGKGRNSEGRAKVST